MTTMLVIDKDLAVHERQQAEWVKYDIAALRLDTMHEGITRLMLDEKYLFIVINEDSVSDFLLLLPFLRDVTDLPVFVFTSNYTAEKKVIALSLGADDYAPFNDAVKDNVLTALEVMKVQGRWANRPAKRPPVLIGCDTILSPSRHSVIVHDTEISLTKKEFEILEYLMANKGRVVSHTLLLQKIWGDDYAESENDNLWRTINRLRGKLSDPVSPYECIKAERGVGYKFIG